MERMDYFSIYELYFLIDSFQGELLLGLPTREDLHVSSEQIWEETKNQLVEKGLLTPEGSLTKAGFVIVEVLREYCLGYSLTVLNNAYIMYSRETNSSILILDRVEGYQLLKLDYLGLLAFLQEKIPVFLREPLPEEKTFLKEEVVLTEEMKDILSSDQTIVIQHYPVQQMSQSRHGKELMEQLLVVEWDKMLFSYHVKEEKLFRYSQYYFLEKVYRWLSIPFREEDFN